MIYEFSAFMFSILTGYVAAWYEGKAISRIAVFMLLSAAGGTLASSILAGVGSLAAEQNSIISLFALVVGHIGSEYLSSKLISRKRVGSVSNIKDTNDMLMELALNKDLKIETEISLKVK